MVFVLPSEFRAPQLEESAIAQLDLGPRPIIFEKPKEKSYKHLKGLYLKGLINSKPVNRMLVDTGAAVNLMPYSVLLLALLKYTFYPLFILDNGMNLISKSLTVLTPA